MKKHYITPEIDIQEIELESKILSGSEELRIDDDREDDASEIGGGYRH